MVLDCNRCHSCWILFQSFFLLMDLDASKQARRKMSLRRMETTESWWSFKKYSFWHSFTLRCDASGSDKVMFPPYVTMLVTPCEITVFHSQDFWNVLGKLKRSILLCVPLAWSRWVHKWKGKKDFRLLLIGVGLLITKQLSLGTFIILEFLRNLSSLP